MAPSKVNRLHPVILTPEAKQNIDHYLALFRSYQDGVYHKELAEKCFNALNKMKKLEQRNAIGNHIIREIGGDVTSLFEPQYSWYMDSCALIQRPSGTFYSGTGCCAGACDLHWPSDDGSNTAYYYIPVVRELSKKKVYTYLRELQGILSGIVNIYGPFKTNGIEFRDAGGITRADSFFSQQTHKNIDYYIVECRITNHRRSLLYWLDFFRPIYCAFFGFISIRTHRQFTPTLTFAYNQPRMYFKLCKLFPNLPKPYCLYLSYVISGAAISSTFYPWPSYKYGPSNSYTSPIVHPIASINAYCSSNYGKVPPTTVDTELRDVKMLNNFLDMTPQSLKENILIIDTLHKLDLTKYL